MDRQQRWSSLDSCSMVCACVRMCHACVQVCTPVCGEQGSTSELFERGCLPSLKLAGGVRLAGLQAWEMCRSVPPAQGLQVHTQHGITRSHPRHRWLFFFLTWMLEIQTQVLILKASALPTEQSPKLPGGSLPRLRLSCLPSRAFVLSPPPEPDVPGP